MKRIRLPYGEGVMTAEIPEERLLGVLEGELNDFRPEGRQEELVRWALEQPVGTPRLRDMARGKRRIVVIASDHTRPVPSRVMMPLMLEELRAGNPAADITILIATGCHREPSRDELIRKFGPEIVEREKIVAHDCGRVDQLTALGTLPSGGELLVNRMAVEADLLCAEGFIEPHFFAGFSGGRKSVLPGIAGRETVLWNHCAEFIHSPEARTGRVDRNPMHRDMLYAARAVGLDFILNVVLNSRKEIVFAVAGECDLAHIRGRDFLSGRCRVKAVPAPIVISTNGGYPLDGQGDDCRGEHGGAGRRDHYAGPVWGWTRRTNVLRYIESGEGYFGADEKDFGYAARADGAGPMAVPDICTGDHGRSGHPGFRRAG